MFSNSYLSEDQCTCLVTATLCEDQCTCLVTATLREDQCTCLIISCSVLLRMKNVSDKSCRENQNAHFTFVVYGRILEIFL
jgi:hypothetical protein